MVRDKDRRQPDGAEEFIGGPIGSHEADVGGRSAQRTHLR